MPMLHPPHPGEILLEEFLRPLGLSTDDGAEVLGVDRQSIQAIVEEAAGISPEMAVRLEKAFGSSADFWLRLQAAFDLAGIRRRESDLHVKRYVAPRASGPDTRTA